MNKKLFILSGAPGAGKSTVLNILKQRNFLCVPEVARQIISEQRSFGGSGVYDKNSEHFVLLMTSRALHQYISASASESLTIFDRGLPDMIVYASMFGLDTQQFVDAAQRYRYASKVFLFPPWREIYCTDEDRTMTFEQSKSFGAMLMETYHQLGYETVLVPKTTPLERAAFLEHQISKIRKSSPAD